MKEQILELRQAGKSYKQIRQILGCSAGTIAYHCGAGQKEKDRERKKKFRDKVAILSKVNNFQDTDRKHIRNKSDDFQRERIMNGRAKLGARDITFKWQDVIEKFGWETTCYLTGRKIELKESKSYQFDHVIPVSKGGSKTIDNLGICCREANQAKHDMFVDELLNLCKEILEHNGYEVRKNQPIGDGTRLESERGVKALSSSTLLSSALEHGGSNEKN